MAGKPAAATARLTSATEVRLGSKTTVTVAASASTCLLCAPGTLSSALPMVMLREGGDGAAIPMEFQARVDNYDRSLNNFSCRFW